MYWLEEDDDEGEPWDQYTLAFNAAIESLADDNQHFQLNPSFSSVESFSPEYHPQSDWLRRFEEFRSREREMETVVLYQVGPATEWWQSSVQLPRAVLTEDISVGIWSLDRLELLQCNNTFLNNLEYSLYDRQKFSTRFLFSSDIKDVLESVETLEAIRALIRNGSVTMTNLSCALVSRSGTLKYLSGVIRVIQDQSGKPIFAISFFRYIRSDSCSHTGHPQPENESFYVQEPRNTADTESYLSTSSVSPLEDHSNVLQTSSSGNSKSVLVPKTSEKKKEKNSQYRKRSKRLEIPVLQRPE